jgi:hypothetical protein
MSLPVTVVAGFPGVWTPSRSLLIQTFTIILVMFVVSLSVFIWAAFFRKPRRHHRQHHYRYPQPPDSAAPNRTAEKPPPVPHRKRIRRREHRRRNPTLAEAGGLPPERVDEPEPPSDSAP